MQDLIQTMQVSITRRLLSALDQQKDLKSALHAFDDLDQVDGLVISVLASMRSRDLQSHFASK